VNAALRSIERSGQQVSIAEAMESARKANANKAQHVA
jgi:hypothetical protein